ncbi:MAG: alcohol dehydrogenase catalytic domain-containing protein [Phycisphaerales bacterium]|nr:alcohol dehydrogenase catalytic domain-containing protein [Phycisphaerales bacterium]MCB9863658.1 alcohol dehydrogenase catalytic domain-containing protein [Phycisphaerales bacterium]
MKALQIHDLKIHVGEIPIPEPGENDVLIRVRLAGVCATDLEIGRGYAGFNGTLGHEFVGIVERGPAALKDKRVVGEINCVCGKCDMCTSGLANHCRRRSVVGIVNRDGAFAEYLTLPARNCHIVPDAISDEQAVFVEPLAAALQVMQQVKIEPRMQVAVLGTGRLGLLVSQVLAKRKCSLTAIGRNPNTMRFLDRKGIRTSLLDDVKSREAFDVVVDCTGSPEGLPIALQLVRPRGTIVMKTTCKSDHSVDLTALVVNEVMLLGSRCGPFGEALSWLARKDVDVSEMVTSRMKLSDGVEIMRKAAQTDQIKVLVQIGD